MSTDQQNPPFRLERIEVPDRTPIDCRMDWTTVMMPAPSGQLMWGVALSDKRANAVSVTQHGQDATWLANRLNRCSFLEQQLTAVLVTLGPQIEGIPHASIDARGILRQFAQWLAFTPDPANVPERGE